jgi:hypothetical protein
MIPSERTMNPVPMASLAAVPPKAPKEPEAEPSLLVTVTTAGVTSFTVWTIGSALGS